MVRYRYRPLIETSKESQVSNPLPPSAARLPTVKEVALLASVSPMTVSRTLAGGKSVRPEVQKRVFDAVAALGYQRNENARSIRPGQPSGLIGVVITNIGNPYYGSFAVGVEDVVSEHGCRMILGTTGEDPRRERQLVADLIGRQIDGLILVPSGGAVDHLLPHRLRNIPLVLASRMADGISSDAVLVDDVGGSIRATRSLLQAGHRRIGYLGNSASTFTGRRRFEGFVAAFAEFQLDVDPDLVKLGQQDADSAEAAATDILETGRPTAIFCANNRNAVGALRAVARLIGAGATADELPAIVSFDTFELSELMPVAVTVIDHDARQLGREAAKMLFDRLDGTFQGQPRILEMPTSIREPRK